jgi:hypothetical protein
VDGTWASPEEIAAIEGCSERSVRMTLPLAFLSPTIVRAVVEGSMLTASASVLLMLQG